MSKPDPLLKASAIASLPQVPIRHPLNPKSEVHLRFLGAGTGLERISVTLGRVPPGRESFVYHLHHHQEEWIYILSGRGMAEIDEREVEVGPGDFMGFPTPSVGHHLRNPFDEELVYLMGGERTGFEVGVFPRHGKRLIMDRDTAQFVDDADLKPFVPRTD
jgi:uncharacterized cupin superfamily protein